MKRFKLIWIFISIILLTSCSPISFNSQTNDNIITPESKNHSIDGTWRIISKDHFTNNSGGSSKLEINDEIYFHSQLVLIKERYTTTPKYVSKFVNAKSYFAFKYGNTNLSEKVKNENKEIISISDGEKLYQDIILLSNTEILFVYGGDFFTAHKVSDEVNKELISSYIAIDQEITSEEHSKENVDTSLLLGIRQGVERNGVMKYKYMTYFIRKNKENMVSVYLTPNIFVPKQSSFWTIEHKVETNGKFKETITAKDDNVTDKTINQINSENELNISFVNPNFISLFSREREQDATSYSLREINQLSRNPLTITDVAGTDGLVIQKEVISKEADKINVAMEEADKLEESTNLGLIRENGKWVFATNLHYETEGLMRTKRVNLNILPAIDLKIDSEKGFSWSQIKNMVPDAIDAVSSPKENLIVIQSSDELLIYTQDNTSYPLASIPLKGNNIIVMDEWAVDRYAGIWEEAFKLTERIPVEYNVNR